MLMILTASGLGRFSSTYSMPECCQSGSELWMLIQGKKFDKSQRILFGSKLFGPGGNGALLGLKLSCFNAVSVDSSPT